MTDREETSGRSTSVVPLVDRLRMGLPARRAWSGPDEFARIQAIGKSVVVMLNCNSGTSASSPGLGLTWSKALTNQSAEGANSARVEIRAIVLANEPRISGVEVTYVQPELDQSDHHICLKMSPKFEIRPFVVDLLYDATGLFRLKQVYFVDR